jgi:transcriptional repressor NrdR
MTQLHGVDQVAYVRFASVYREFKDVTQFMDELTGLLKDNRRRDARSGP